MWKCPICSNEENEIYICQKCGYDKRKDFVRNRTISQVPKQDADACIKLIADYDAAEQAKKAAAAKALLDAIKKEQEKKAEEEKMAAAAAKALLDVIKKEQEKKAEEERKAKEAAEAARRIEEARRADEARRAEEAKRAEALKRAEEAEQKRKAAEQAALKEREAMRASIKEREERSKTQKKSVIGRVIAGMMVFGIFGCIGATMSQKQSEVSAGDSIWYTIKQASMHAMIEGNVDYSSTSLDELYEQWSQAGYDVTAPEVYSYDSEDGTLTERKTSVRFPIGENLYYDIYCTEPYGLSSVENEYLWIEFSCYEDPTDPGIDANQKAYFDTWIPLPMEIEFGDSFEMVSAKLGLSAAGVEPGIYTLYEPEYLYANYADPQSGVDSDSKFIYLGGEDYGYYYGFYENKLTSYMINLEKNTSYSLSETEAAAETQSTVDVPADTRTLEDLWYDIKTESVYALDGVFIDYETYSLSEMSEWLNNYAFTVNLTESSPENSTDGLEHHNLEAYVSAESAYYYIYIYDQIGPGANAWTERMINFGNSSNDAGYVANQAWHGWQNLFNPMPFDIKLDDSLETVLLKMGINKEELEEGYYSYNEKGILSIGYEAPVNGSNGYLYIGDTKYSFNYMFTGEGILFDYNVLISR